MARRPRVKSNKYNYQKQLKKVLKNPKKRDHAGIVVFVNGNDLEYPPRIVDLDDSAIKVKDTIVAKKFFESTKIRISTLPAVFVSGSDVMTSVGMHYTHLVPGRGEEDEPKKIVVDGYYIEEEGNKKKHIKHKHAITKEFQPSETLPPAILQSIIIEETKVGDIKKWLEKNKTMLYLAFGVCAVVVITLYFVYEMKSDLVPQAINACKACANAVTNTCGSAAQKVSEVVSLN